MPRGGLAVTSSVFLQAGKIPWPDMIHSSLRVEFTGELQIALPETGIATNDRDDRKAVVHPGCSRAALRRR